jgi:rubrerythrin
MIQYTALTIQCPQCGYEEEDFYGLRMYYCPSCGYCVHASITSGVCDSCGKMVDPEDSEEYNIREEYRV